MAAIHQLSEQPCDLAAVDVQITQYPLINNTFKGLQKHGEHCVTSPLSLYFLFCVCPTPSPSSQLSLICCYSWPRIRGVRLVLKLGQIDTEWNIFKTFQYHFLDNFEHNLLKKDLQKLTGAKKHWKLSSNVRNVFHLVSIWPTFVPNLPPLPRTAWLPQPRVQRYSRYVSQCILATSRRWRRRYVLQAPF